MKVILQYIVIFLLAVLMAYFIGIQLDKSFQNQDRMIQLYKLGDI